MIKEPQYKIGDKVYHNTPDSDQGIITSITYDYKSKTHSYLVSLSLSKSEWCEEIELTDTKIF